MEKKKIVVVEDERIVALEDLTTHRSYRNAFPLSEALEEISANSGYKYDPKVVAACLELFREKGYNSNK